MSYFKRKWLLACVLLIGMFTLHAQKDLTPYNLQFNALPATWDEGLPLGNGLMGALIWEKDGKLRLSLDRIDLWDLRKMEHFDGDHWRYQWVVDKWKTNSYEDVQKAFDVPYNKKIAPSKIPGGAMEFATADLGKVKSATLAIQTALSSIEWESGSKFNAFVHAEKPIGWFSFEGENVQALTPLLDPPPYMVANGDSASTIVTGHDLRHLAYPQGTIVKLPSGWMYTQPGWNGFVYQIIIQWKKTPKGLEGCWTISTNADGSNRNALELSQTALNQGFNAAFAEHKNWWSTFWAKSDLQVPDPILQNQWYLEQYKFGSAARENTPPISLQAVWTADNGKLPPWKGDFHHDLNTQLSYWPCYTSNHLDLGKGFLNWLQENSPTFKSYTRNFYEADGLNVPGVSTLKGEPMGGWIQYSFGPTVSAWLSHHFYLHWRYSMDKEFLEKEGYPWMREVAIFLDDIAETDENGMRNLPISSSPEIHDNKKEAWFGQTTNFDLANIRFVYAKAAEMAKELGKHEEAKRWTKILAEWPAFASDETGLLIAPNERLTTSHRHFSHLMAIHPLSLINWSDGEYARQIIRNSLGNLEELGSDYWTGYSFSWLGNLQARMLDGDAAAESLRIFATSFCLPNSFHVNGDQSGKGYSKFKYRPFTLEGNFAYAAGLQEMLLQSHEDFIRLFPAIPAAWETAAFADFLAQGGYTISAEKRNASAIHAVISSAQGGELKIMNPFNQPCRVNDKPLAKDAIWHTHLKPNEEIVVDFVVE